MQRAVGRKEGRHPSGHPFHFVRPFFAIDILLLLDASGREGNALRLEKIRPGNIDYRLVNPLVQVKYRRVQK